MHVDGLTMSILPSLQRISFPMHVDGLTIYACPIYLYMPTCTVLKLQPQRRTDMGGVSPEYVSLVTAGLERIPAHFANDALLGIHTRDLHAWVPTKVEKSFGIAGDQSSLEFA